MRPIAFASLLFSLLTVACRAQMPSPEIDRLDRPFSYFSQPTDQIGVAGSPYATEVTPEGYLYTGFGELMFFVGPDLAPLSTNDGPRYRTLEDGYVPIEMFEVVRGGVHYKFVMFAASLGEQPQGAVANFVRVTVENRGTEPASAFLAAAVRFETPQVYDSPYGENRFNRPMTPKVVNRYRQIGERFDPNWTYGFEANAFVRNGKVIYMFPESPKPVLDGTVIRRFNYLPDATTRQMEVTPTTPVGAAKFAIRLAPGESRTLDFKMPLVPEAAYSETMTKLKAAAFDDFHAQVREYWHKEIARGMQLSVPEAKVNDLFRACMVNDLLALNHIDRDWVQTVNQLHYHGFYLRDSADFVHMYDVTGRTELADDILRFDVRMQQPDGNFLSQKGQFDGWGQTLWIYGFHYRFTHDHGFAERVYPSVLRAVEWFEKATAADALHVMPATDVKDNEYVPGHLTGYNFLALDGLGGAIALARGLGKTTDAERFERDYNEFRKNFLAVLDKRAAANGNAIPPALDGDSGGADWGNLLGLTPEPQLDPHDPKISATLARSLSHYEEGISVYNQPVEGQFLHHYLTIKNMLTEVERGDQRLAIDALYGVTLHTSATNSGFETSIRPWGDRDFAGNLAPHGWFAAEYRNVLRAMLVREEHDDELHLLSAISPAWVGEGKTIELTNAPTMFGQVNLTLRSTTDDTAVLSLAMQLTQAPRRIVLHLPWFMQTKSVTADGKQLGITGDTVEIPEQAKTIAIQWKRRPDVPALSFGAFVEAYKTAYRKHYAEYLRTATPYAQ
ncbi:MAG: hypothetical protein V4555_01610 [Acidobacteriota bacterium]